MLHPLRKFTPFLIGSAFLILALDAVTLLYRALGLAKGTALYAALVTILSVGAVLIQRRVRKDSRSTASTDNKKGTD